MPPLTITPPLLFPWPASDPLIVVGSSVLILLCWFSAFAECLFFADFCKLFDFTLTYHMEAFFFSFYTITYACLHHHEMSFTNVIVICCWLPPGVRLRTITPLHNLWLPSKL